MASENRATGGSLNAFVLPAVSMVLLLCGCRPGPANPVKIECRVLPQPARVGSADIQIQLFDDAKHRNSPARVSVEADMAHPGMRPIFASLSAMGDNKYQARMDFNMPGDWILLVRARWDDGTSADKQLGLVVRQK